MGSWREDPLSVVVEATWPLLLQASCLGLVRFPPFGESDVGQELSRCRWCPLHAPCFPSLLGSSTIFWRVLEALSSPDTREGARPRRGLGLSGSSDLSGAREGPGVPGEPGTRQPRLSPRGARVVPASLRFRLGLVHLCSGPAGDGPTLAALAEPRVPVLRQ